MEGRFILDNSQIAFEIIHKLKLKTRGNFSELALKIDISKAYDKVDWNFLKNTMLSMDFSDKWVQWMMMCVTLVNYSVLVNSNRVRPIQPRRGLRQGDPLSPYLFILIAEGLSSLIRSAANKGDIHSIKIYWGALTMSHLLFADYCFLFCEANLNEVHHLMETLKVYEEARTQFEQVRSFFNRNLSIQAKEDLSRIMGVRHVMGTGTHLGLPSMIGRSKKAIFMFIKDRIWKRTNS